MGSFLLHDKPQTRVWDTCTQHQYPDADRWLSSCRPLLPRILRHVAEDHEPESENRENIFKTAARTHTHAPAPPIPHVPQTRSTSHAFI